MFLKRLYSNPSELFRSGKPEHPYTIVFKKGFNFIFGKKDKNTDSKASLNGIGKSTLCDLIDFCLLADFSSRNTRLYKEKKRLENHEIILEFEVNDTEYIIKRNVNNSNVIEFGQIGNEKEIEIKEAKIQLFHLVFDNPEYLGVLQEGWYRSLMSFFIKIHRKKSSKGDFSDPINFLTANNKIYQINQFHFFLLNLDNKLISENYEIQKDAKNRNNAITQVKKLIERNYNLDINHVDSQLSKMKNEVNKIKIGIDSFKLADSHKNAESNLNELTAKIKDLSEENFWTNKKVESYKKSFEVIDTISESKIRSIEKLYTELNVKLKGVITKTLEEAVEFRKEIAQSREEFLREEIQELEVSMRNKERQIQELDLQRQKLFSFLKSKKAFTDLTEAFYVLGEKEKEMADLDGKIKIYRDLQNEKTSNDIKDATLKQDINTFLLTIEEKIEMFEKLFSDVYSQIYFENETLGFSITPDYGVNKANINISFEKDESKGWNKGRTLIYDISVLINAIQQKINIPYFLIHDGIFDGMDKAHFVALYNYVQKLQKKGIKFQYIVTMIEEGQLNSDFGETDDLTTEKISEMAIAVLSKKNPFWV